MSNNVDSPNSKPHYAGSGIELKPTVPPPSKIEVLQRDVHTVPSAPPPSKSLVMEQHCFQLPHTLIVDLWRHPYIP